MHVLITGAAGMIGRKVLDQLARDPQIGGRPVSRVTLNDVVAPTPPETAFPVELITSDFSAPGSAESLVAGRPDVILHLAAIPSSGSEEDFEGGYRVNFDGTRQLLDAIRRHPGYRPRLVFTSTIAVFGAPFPDTIGDEFFLTPLTSYGTAKAMIELLMADYTRRGFLDGVAIRLPTICVRPGKPNKAASGFFSGIMREPLVGQDAILPVPDTVRHWHASPRAAVRFILHAAALDGVTIGPRRSLSMPGVSVTVAEQIEALRSIAGEAAVARIRPQPDADILRIVEGWPRDFSADRAIALGFEADCDFREILEIHIADELHGTIVR